MSDVVYAVKRVWPSGEVDWFDGVSWARTWLGRRLYGERIDVRAWNRLPPPVVVRIRRVVRPKPMLVSDLELWVLTGARDGRAAFAFFPSAEHTAAWESCSARGWICTVGHVFTLTTDGEAILRQSTKPGAKGV